MHRNIGGARRSTEAKLRLRLGNENVEERGGELAHGPASLDLIHLVAPRPAVDLDVVVALPAVFVDEVGFDYVQRLPGSAAARPGHPSDHFPTDEVGQLVGVVERPLASPLDERIDDSAWRRPFGRRARIPPRSRFPRFTGLAPQQLGGTFVRVAERIRRAPGGRSPSWEARDGIRQRGDVERHLKRLEHLRALLGSLDSDTVAGPDRLHGDHAVLQQEPGPAGYQDTHFSPFIRFYPAGSGGSLSLLGGDSPFIRF